MAQKSNSHDQQKKTRQNGLPVSIHPDDAKDKVFTAIMKALLKMGNKPSSPKELANIIVKHKYATLGGATPFATVSSRISQHFKRAAEHNPPRAPLLAKHVDQNHSRKINYSLATEDNPTSATNSTMPAENAVLDSTDHAAANTTMATATKDAMRTNSKIRRNPMNTTSKSSSEEEDSDEEEEEDESEIHFHPSKRYKTEHTNAPISPSIHPAQSEPQPSTIEGVVSVINEEEEDGEESEGELSDYHEEMLKGDEDLDSLSARRLSRRQSKQKSTLMQTNTTKITDTTSINKPTTTTHSNTTIPIATTSTTPTISVTTTSHPTSPSTSNTTTATPAATTTTKVPPTLPVNTGARKPSFSFSSGFPGDQELWTPFSFEHDFDNVFLQDGSSSHHIPFNIATPESVSVSELDDYFTSTTSSTVNHSTSASSTARSQRKSFSSAMLGPNDKSLLQKVLLASAARGVADKIEEEDEATEKEPVIKEEKKPKEQDIKSFSSSSLLDVDNSEDFVKFEDDEKKELPPVTKKPAPEILPASAAVTPTTPVAQQQQQQQQQQQAATILSAAEILKSMNIQNLNLSALHQMTSSINSLQQLSPTFDLAKTMAAYMQSLAKSANANASSSSNSPHAMDLKSILTRFPALEAFIKKDPVVSATPPTPPAPVSPNIDFIPNLVSATEPIVHTLTPSTPPMYITLIDHIAVCIVVLSKTDHTPEYRIMRRVDTGFINGTVLLTAGGIETESERSMILSFEMERVRMPKKKSELFGTWIPLRRAQELAVTCSIQHKLGHFLEDSIESYFPNPLPIQVNTRKPQRDSRLTALALAALRSDSSKSNGFIVSPISRQSSSSGSMGAAQLQELLLTHPHKALKSNGLNKPPPLLGRYEEEEKEEKKSNSVKSNTSSVSGKDESDVDIVNSSDSSVNAASSNEDDEEDEDEESENDDMEDILKRNKQTLHVHPHDLLKKRRRSQEEVEVPEESKATKIPRKKGSGSKWTSASGKSTATVSTNAKKPSTIIIKKNSASIGGKKNAVKKDTVDIKNVVVEHRPVVEPKVEDTKATEEEDDDGEGMDDEDEDIDIGGSDFDDDLR